MTTSKPIGSAVLRYEIVESTNITAVDLLRRNEIGHGAVIIAKDQSNGKGQRGNSWNSEKGENLLCSFVLRPSGLLASNQFLLSAVAALAVQHTVEKTLLNAPSVEYIKVKWPNDVLINKKKVAGILIENSVQSNEVSTSVIGIGINVNQMEFLGLPHASSLRQFTEAELDIEDVFASLVANINAFYALVGTDPSLLLELLKDHLFGLHTWVALDVNGLKEEFRILGIETDGRLKIETRSFRMSSVHQHEVKWIDFQ